MSHTGTMEQSAKSRALAKVVYLVGIVLILNPLTDAIISAGTPQWGNVQWRFGAAGFLMNALLLPIVGATAILVVAHVQGSFRVQRAVAVVSGVAGIALVLTLVLFLLDALQLREIVQPRILRRFDATMIRMLITDLLLAAALFALARTGWRISRTSRHLRSAAATADLLVVSVPPSGS